MTEKEQTTKLEANNNYIFIGKKPIKNYLGSINLQLRKNNSSEIIIKARGKFISKAVDIAEVAKRNSNQQFKTKDIIINTEEYDLEKVENSKENDKKIKVSTIEITLSK